MIFTIATFDEIGRLEGVKIHKSEVGIEQSVNCFVERLDDVEDVVLELRDAIVVPRGGVIWKNYWIPGSEIQYYPSNWRELEWIPGKILGEKEIEISEEFIKKADFVRDPHVFVDSTVAQRNFGHFIHDTVVYTSVVDFITSICPEVSIAYKGLVFPNSKDIFNTIFESTKISECIHAEQMTRFDHLFLPSRRSVLDAGRMAISFRGLRRARSLLLSRFGFEYSLDFKFKIFLYRATALSFKTTGTVANRDFRNIPELNDALLEKGFIAVECGSLTIKELIFFISHASHIVGVHGANLTNILFAKPGTKVFEIHSWTGNWLSIQAIASALQLEGVVCRQSEPPAGSGPLVNIEGLMTALDG